MSSVYKFFWPSFIMLSFALAMLTTSCRSSSATATGEYGMQAQPLQSRPVPSAAKTSRGQAVQSLIRQGKAQLEQGDSDAALANFARGVSLDPNCGVCEYGLAEAWLKKGDREQAREHHLRAQRLLAEKPAWQARLKTQKKSL